MCLLMMPFMIPLGMILFPLIYTLLDNLIYILPLLLLGGLIYCLVQMLSDSDVKRSCESFAKEVKSNCEHFVGEARKRRECFTKNMCCSRKMGSCYGTMDLAEADDSFLVLIDLPGVKKEEIKVEVEQNTITVSGERKMEEESKLLIQERTQGTFNKVITLPESADMDTVMAKYEDGVLSIVVSKKEECKTERKNIRID